VSSTQFRRVSAGFFVAPQLQAADFPAARAAGIRTIINNRPDGEAADQLTDAEARVLAQANGLNYVFLPVVTGGMRPEVIGEFADAIADHPGPHLAYCRSGTRSCHMWAFATAADRPVAMTIELAAAAGYDLTPARPMVEQLAAGH
jgi:sulfide:quinone oxidoreductase